jgi:hypothetical protein
MEKQKQNISSLTGKLPYGGPGGRCFLVARMMVGFFREETFSV